MTIKLVFNMGLIIPPGTLPDGEKIVQLLPYHPSEVSLTMHLETLRRILSELKQNPLFTPDMPTYICMNACAHSFAGALMIIEAMRGFNNWPEIWISNGLAGEWIQTNRFIGEGMDWAMTYEHDTNEPSIIDLMVQAMRPQ